MRLSPDEEQRALRSAVRSMLAPRVQGGGAGAGTYADLASAGVTGLIIPEVYGGAGDCWVELSLVLEELGATLQVPQFLPTAVLSAAALAWTEIDERTGAYLRAIASGELLATCAVAETSGRWDAAGIRADAVMEAASWRLSGQKDCVLSAAESELLIVAARTPLDGVELFAVDAAASGVHISRPDVLDPSRPQDTVVLDGAVGHRLGAPGSGEQVLPRLTQLGAAALSAELLGVMRTALAATLDHVKTREQFSRPIGSFQAVKHICADMHVALESARVTTAYAWAAIASGASDESVAISAAKAVASDAAMLITGAAIQLHGGIGFAMEHPAHRWLRRAKSSTLMFGDVAEQRQLTAAWMDTHLSAVETAS